jgi:hypothetical protein
MSTNASAATAPATASKVNSQARDLRRVRILRFAVGSTAATAIAYAYEWPLFYLTPVLTIVFLSKPMPNLKRGMWKLIVYVVAAVALGLVFTLFLTPFPLVYVPLLGLAIFNVYYLLNRRGPFFLAIMSLLALLILPLTGMAYEELALAFGGYFAFGVSLAIIICIAAQTIFPDPPGTPATPRPNFQPGFVRPAAQAALKSTLTVLPLAVLFMVLELYTEILVLVYAGILSLVPQASSGWAAGKKSLLSTLLGCLAAIADYWLLVAVPEYHFFLVLWFLFMMIFAGLIFSDHPLASHMGSAATAMTVLVSGSLAADANFFDNVIVRVVLITLATIYVSVALAIIDRYLFGKRN